MIGEYITLPCNVTSFSDNTIGEYKTHLSLPKTLKGKWSVGLAKISYTRSWFNVKHNQKIYIFDDKGLIYTSNVLLKAGCYENEQQLVDALSICINSVLDIMVPSFTHESSNTYPRVITKPGIHFNKNSRRVTLFSGKISDDRILYLNIGEELEKMLGLSRLASRYSLEQNDVGNGEIDIMQKEIKGGEDPFSTYDLNAGIHSLFVYCNIVEPVSVGDTSAQLLATVGIPARVKFGHQCEERYDSPFYVPLATNCFQTIQISVRDDNGEIIPFKFGRVIVTLHLKQDVPP